MKNGISMHGSIACGANLRTYIQAAREAGFDYIEPTKTQLRSFLGAGYTAQDIKALLGPVKISSVGWLADIERQGYRFVEMMKEAEELFALAHSVGSEAVEIINGPVDWHAVECYQKGLPYQGYMGLQGLPEDEQIRLTAKNARALADLAKDYSLTLFFEPLCWTPIPSLKEGISVLEHAERDNLKVVVDFYHNYMAGLSPEFIAGLDKNIILGVHIAASRKPDGHIPCEEIYRDAGFHDTAVPLQEWVDAVKKTGFENWWTYETFSRRELENETFSFAKEVHRKLVEMIF